MAPRLQTSPDTLQRQLNYLVALYDIGNCSIVFQAVDENCWPGGAFGSWPADQRSKTAHGDVTALYTRKHLRGALDEILGNDDAATRDRLVDAIAGHHGSPPKRLESLPAGSNGANQPFVDAAQAIVREVWLAVGGGAPPAAPSPVMPDDCTAAALS